MRHCAVEFIKIEAIWPERKLVVQCAPLPEHLDMASSTHTEWVTMDWNCISTGSIPCLLASVGACIHVAHRQM